MDIAWFQSRYDKAGPGGTGADYINCPMTKAEYDAFVDALLAGEQHKHHDWEKVPYFDGCLPIEVMAERGRETLRHGPMKPVGLTNRHKPGEKPYAVVQLRQDNALGTLFNMVGFQTKLRYAIQADIFRMIPGLGERAVRPPRRPPPQHLPQFAEASRRDAPAEGDAAAPLRRTDHRLRGLCRVGGDRAPRRPLRRRRASRRSRWPLPPATTAFGAILGHITGGHLSDDAAGQALLPADERQFRPVPADRSRRASRESACPAPRRGAARKRAISHRALADLDRWLGIPAAEAAE